MEQNDFYKDIQMRTNGEIYIGVVGPVRTGKSTFIKRFMEEMVLPRITDLHNRQQAKDELPQSGNGTVIMTSEPKFVPKTAISFPVDEHVQISVRCIDCVGFMVEGASGHEENGKERLVHTPWYEDPIPFSSAAEIGTEKVIKDHSTVGIMITTDGSFSEIPRTNYEPAEEKTIFHLKSIGKPFIVLVNSTKPYSKETLKFVEDLKRKYDVLCHAVNCEQLKKNEIEHILQSLLYAFPVTRISLYLPHWYDILPKHHDIKKNSIHLLKNLINDVHSMNDFLNCKTCFQEPWIKKYYIEKMDLSNGAIDIHIELNSADYYHLLSEMIHVPIQNESHFYKIIKELSDKKQMYENVEKAIESAEGKGYGLVMPKPEQVKFNSPELIRHGSKFGVNIKAFAPSIHMITATIETEIAPIVGTEDQAKDLIRYIQDHVEDCQENMWNTSIFGKSIGQLVEEGIQTKIHRLNEESQTKMQETLEKIINDSNGGVIFVII